MALPNFQPISQTSLSILPATGTIGNVVPNLPLGVYANSPTFVTGAADQVSFVYQMLGGNVLDIEIGEENVYAAYESAVLEYSYLVNLYQGKSSLSSFLGQATGSFDSNGQLISGSALSGSNVALKYPKFSFSHFRNLSDQIAYEAGIGGNVPYYSASFDVIENVQDYDLQAIVSSSAAAGNVEYANAINSSGNKKIRILKVFYKSPTQIWRFFGYYGGLSVVGNLQSYGQYADDSTFSLIPTWQNKLQAMAFEDALYTRTSHWTFEIRNNKLRIFPVPTNSHPPKMWFIFSLDPNPIEEDENSKTGVNGVNNLNTLPFENIPYESINSMGLQWIRRYCLALCKGILGQTRGKIQTIPIPGDSVTLNHDQLLSQSAEEIEKLREELKLILEETSYSKLMETDASIVENAMKVHQYIPKLIFVG